MTDADAAALLGIILIYVPRPYARQLLWDIEMSRAAERDEALRRTVRRLVAVYDKQFKSEGSDSV